MIESVVVEAISKHPDYQLLKRVPLTIKSRINTESKSFIATIVDLETMGLDATKNEIIEVGLLSFSFSTSDGILAVVDSYNELNDPGKPIPAEVTKVTGITDVDVKGKAIDWDLVLKMFEKTELVICQVLSQIVGHRSKICIFAKERAEMISFKWRHFRQDVILMLVRWYVAYSLSYRDIEELALERGLKVDHSTINRWVIEYSPQLEEEFRKRYKRPVGISWRMDETYIKVKSQWVYLYRAVDKEGKTVDFMLSEKRDEPAARAFFEKAIGSNGLPDKVTMDKSGANKAGIDTINLQLALLFMMGGLFIQLTVRQIKYLNNIVEQDHRFIKKITKPMKGFKAFHSADATLTGIELHHMLRKKQHNQSDNQTIFEQFYGLAA